MDAILRCTRALARHWVAALVLLLPSLAASPAWAQDDPPSRVATLTEKQGAVAWAPAGESEWLDATRNRPLTRGDRLWVDAGGRAELHAGSAALQLDGRTALDITQVDAGVVQATLHQGSAVARVRQLGADDSFEIDTPQLALRASAPGEFRVDVDLENQFTRVSVRSGVVTAYGANGASREIAAGDPLAFTGRDLALALGVPTLGADDFDRWAAARNRDEDRSIAARYVPRTVVGYAQLDRYGRWAVDSTWGPVWYPAVTVVNWAPYRYGHWEWIAPWGWTWIDDAPWGFAPFHYGRWVQLGPRWAWVPGRLGPRPVYAPALVGFVGGAGWNLTVRSGPGIGWYPLAPWEPWRPWYRTSTVYVQQVNQVVVLRREPAHFQRPPGWFSAMPLREFEAGRPVPPRPGGLDRRALLQAPPAPPPVLADGRRFALETQPRAPLRAPPPAQALPPPVVVHPVPAPVPRRFVPAQPGARQLPAGTALPPGLPPRDAVRGERPGPGGPPRTLATPPGVAPDAQAAQQAQRLQQEQLRVQQARDRAQQAGQARQDAQRSQQEAVRAQQAQQRAAQEDAQRQQQAQRRAQQEQQRAQQEQQRAVQQQERAAQDAQRQQREQGLRAQQQERAVREQQRLQAEQQRAAQQAHQRAQQEAQRLQREQQRAQPGPGPQPLSQEPQPQRGQGHAAQQEHPAPKPVRPVPQRPEPAGRGDEGGRRP